MSDTFDSGVLELLRYLQDQGQVGEFASYGGQGMETKGRFDPKTKAVTLQNAASMRDPNSLLLHELVHALQYGTLPDRTQQIANMVMDLQKTSEGSKLADQLVLPAHWTAGQMEQHRIKGTTPIIQNAEKTMANQAAVVPSTLLESYEEDEYPVERQAYYLTHPALGVNKSTELGRYLRNYGIPWSVISNLP